MNLPRTLVLMLPSAIASAATSFGAVYIYTRLLGPESYGLYALVFVSMTIWHTLMLLWIEAAVFRFMPRAERRGRIPDLMATFWRMWTRMMAPTLGLAGAALIFLPLSMEARLAGAAAVSAVIIESLANLRREMLRAQGRIGYYAILETSRSLGTLAIGVWLAATTDLGAAAPFAGMAIASAVAMATQAPALRRASIGGRPRRALMVSYANYALPLTAVLILSSLLAAGDRFLIAYYLGEAAVGAYAAAYGLADKTVLMVFVWAGIAAAPVLLRAFEFGGGPAALEAAKKAANTLLLISAPTAVGVALVAEPLARVVIAEALRPGAAELMPWISAGALLNGFMIYYFKQAFDLMRRTHVLAVTLLAPVLLNLGLNAVLIPRFGLPGAVASTLVCYIVAVLAVALIGRRWMKLPMPLVSIVKVGTACAAMAGVVLMLPSFENGLLEIALKGSVGAVIFVALALILDAADARSWVSGALDFMRQRKTARAA